MNYKINTFLAALFVVVCLSSSAQKIHDIDLTLINSVISVPNSPFEYARLKKRMIELDTTLNDYEYQLLYFGSTFQPEYHPYSKSAAEERFIDFYREGNYQQAFPIIDSVLNENPVNLSLLLRAAVCANVLKLEARSDQYIAMYNGLFKTILNTGTGWSEEDAMVVICVDDEYEIMKMWEIGFTEQALLGSIIDCFKLDKATRKDLKKNGVNTKSMYFNIEIPFNSLLKEFKDSNE